LSFFREFEIAALPPRRTVSRVTYRPIDARDQAKLLTQGPRPRTSPGARPFHRTDQQKAADSISARVPRKQKQIKGSKMAFFLFPFISFYFPESGLINGLRAKK
jgi:hypothetical protein